MKPQVIVFTAHGPETIRHAKKLAMERGQAMTDQKVVEYRNPWYKSSKDYGPEKYTTMAKPVEYRGYLIFHRVKSASAGGDCWDIVKSGICVGQYAGLSGAKGAIDTIGGEEYSRLRENVERFVGKVVRDDEA